MQGSKSNFFAKSEKRARFDDEFVQRNGGGKRRNKMEKNKQARREANRNKDKSYE